MKNKFIKVFDNIIPHELQDSLEDLALSGQVSWFYQKNISGIEQDNTIGFSHGMYTGIDFLKTSPHLLFTYLQVPYLLSNYLKLNIKEVYTSRLFLFPPSPNPQTIYKGIHTDLEFFHSVCLYYINDADGDTVFFDDDKKTEIQRISPKKGRIAFFSGNIPHCTSTPKNNTRVIFNTNFLIEEFGKKEKN